MLGLTHNIRTAVRNDIPHLIALAEMHYNEHFDDGKFDPLLCERYINSIMLDPDAIGIVIEDRSRIPVGYLSGVLDHMYLTNEPDAVTHNWFVHNPKGQYGNKNYGLEMLKAFEDWAKAKGATGIRLGITMKPKQKRVFDRVFKKLDYNVETVYYKKDITNG